MQSGCESHSALANWSLTIERKYMRFVEWVLFPVFAIIILLITGALLLYERIRYGKETSRP